jgi:hypothetical protein
MEIWGGSVCDKGAERCGRRRIPRGASPGSLGGPFGAADVARMGDLHFSFAWIDTLRLMNRLIPNKIPQKLEVFTSVF